MNRDLFLAILAMDSYNRGYGAGVNLPTGATHIGRAEILPDSEQRPQITRGQAAGFYAIAYDMTGVAGFADGERVISYRGTDRFFNNPFGNGPGSDFWAFGIGVGQPFALTGGLTDQARLTIEFFRAVAGDGADPFAANITTTGHSLGGGLAGYAAMLYGWTLGGGGVDVRPAMLTANHRAVAANNNQPDAGLKRAFRFGEARTAA
jgi:hypothetical protein